VFSVLIASYNNEKYLETAIKSVLQQTYQDFEIVIVDDCSTDNSFSILDKYKNDNRFVIEFLSKDSGCGFAKRRCVELAKGEFCGFLDSDDALTQNALEDMVQAHLENPNASLVSSCYYRCDENLRIMYLRKLKPYCENFLHANDVDLHFSSFKRELYLKTSGIDPEFKRAVDQDSKISLLLQNTQKRNFHYYQSQFRQSIPVVCSGKIQCMQKARVRF